MSRLNQLFMGKPIVTLLNEDSDVSAVLHIQRAGAAQVLLLPFQPGQLRAALDTVARQFGCPTTSSKVIAVLGASEGCGATTLAINLSDAIANEHHKSCILVELSLRLGRLGSYLNIEPMVTISDLLAGDSALEVNAVNLALVRVTDRFQVMAGPHRSCPFSAQRKTSRSSWDGRGRLRVPATRFSLLEGRRGDGDHPAARGAVSRWRRGTHPHQTCQYQYCKNNVLCFQ